MDNPGKWYGNEYPHFSGKSARTKGAERLFLCARVDQKQLQAL
jgi:hypothetical protein